MKHFRKEKEVNELQQKIEDDASEIAALQRKIRELEVCMCSCNTTVYMYQYNYMHLLQQECHYDLTLSSNYYYQAKIEELEEDLENEKRMRQKVRHYQ